MCASRCSQDLLAESIRFAHSLVVGLKRLMVVRSGESSVRLRNNCNAGVDRSQSVTKSGGHSLTNTYHLGGSCGLDNFSNMMIPTRSKAFRKNL